MTGHAAPSGQAHTTGLHVDDVGRDVYELSSAADASGLINALHDVFKERTKLSGPVPIPRFLAGATIRFVQAPHDNLLAFQITFPK